METQHSEKSISQQNPYYYLPTTTNIIIIDKNKNNNALTTLTTSLGLGLGLGFGFLYLLTPQTVKPLSAAIKAADGALKGTRALNRLSSPSPSSLLYISKTLISVSHKASKHLTFPQTTSQNLSLVTKKLKASVAALNLLRYLRFPPNPGNGFLGFGVLAVYYKFSKNLLRVLEGFMGLQIDSALRTGFEAVEIFVKTAFVAREFSRISKRVGVRLGFEVEDDGAALVSASGASSSSSSPAYAFVRSDGRRKSRARLNCRRSRIDSFGCCGYYSCRDYDRSCVDYSLVYGDFVAEESLQSSHLFEVLCLALPVPKQKRL